MNFEELDLNDDILDGLDAMNFTTCTPIQENAIPIILNHEDLLASAQTGTGKTAAYLLPLLELLSKSNRTPNKVNALILLPTRELVQQVDQLLGGFAYYTNISWVPIYGGNDGLAFGQQQKALQTGGDIAVATPGRLLSILHLNDVDLSQVEYLILDEADRMLDIGFYDDIMEIIGHLPPKRQTMMFSATFPPDVEKLARQILSNPASVKIAVSKPAEGINQGIYLLHESQKIPLILELFKNQNKGKSIIFLSSKEKVKQLYRSLKKLGINAAQIHSDLDQNERTQVLLDFKNNKIQVLTATDVVSRGIDIDDIENVINYDVPAHPEDYVHRIGRTARAGSKGNGITLVTGDEFYKLRRIEKLLEKKIPRLQLPKDIADMAPAINENDLQPKKYVSKGKNTHHSIKNQSLKNQTGKSRYYKGNNRDGNRKQKPNN